MCYPSVVSKRTLIASFIWCLTSMIIVVCLASVFRLFEPAQSRHGFASSMLPLHILWIIGCMNLQGCLLNHYFHPFVLTFLLKHHLSLLQNLASTIEGFYFDKGKVLRLEMKSRWDLDRFLMTKNEKQYKNLNPKDLKLWYQTSVGNVCRLNCFGFVSNESCLEHLVGG